MIYFEYMLILAVFLLAGANIFYFMRRIRYDHFHKIVVKAMVKKQSYQRGGGRYFNSKALKCMVIFLLKQRQKKAKTALLYLCFGRTSQAKSYFQKYNQEYFFAVLEAFDNPLEALDLFEKIVKKKPNDYDALSDLASLYFIKGNQPKAKLTLERIDLKKASAYAKAKSLYYQSFFFLQDGDMLSASENCALSGKLFNKEKAFIEEAESYLMTGTIYRVACVEDVAQFMFEAAEKIFGKWDDNAGRAEVFGNIGMLMVLQERFEEAEDKFLKALEITQQNGRNENASDIYNQLALMNILQKKYSAASELLEKSQEISHSALAYELQAHLFYEQKDYTEALSHAVLARNMYKGTANVSAYFETMYMSALAAFAMEDYSSAEETLREIMTISKKKKTAFHVANAYNLLGLIFLKKGELQRAKVLFQEAVAMEQKNDRFSGAATDFANIGLIELKCGRLEEAQKNLETAVEYAKAYGETELSKLLEEKLSDLKA